MTELERKRESLKRRYGRAVPAPRGHMGPGPGGPGRRRPAMAKGTPKNSRETVRRLLHYLNEDKAKMSLAFFCVIVNTVASLAGSYMLRPIINRYIVPVDGSRGDAAGLAKALLMLTLV